MPGASADAGKPAFDDRIYVFTPQATVVELTAGATPIDFAYAVHTDLGHRCRGAKVDGRVVPLATPLQSGQTVEITAAKTGGPSLDWLNPELGYLRSPRSKAKVRSWFNALATDATVARGREAVEKVLQREGKTALKLEDLAAQLGFRSAEALFEVVGKDELSLRNIEALLRPAPEPKADEDEIHFSRPRAEAGGVLVVGVESLLTNLARCCRPAPPDAIAGYVTRGKGVAVHRVGCSNLRALRARAPERVIPVAWGATDASRPALYPVDVQVEASDRQGLLRDVSEVFAKEKTNVTGVKSSSVKDAARRHRLHDLHRRGRRRRPAGGDAGPGLPRPRRARRAPPLGARRSLHRDRRRPVDRHRGDAVLRRALDHPVGVGEVDEAVALPVDHAHDAQLLEHERDPLVEHLLLRLERLARTVIGPTWRQAIDASALSSARPSPPLMPPVLARDT